MQIRKAMTQAEHRNLLTGIVEMDEAYVGGKPRKGNKREDDKPGTRGHARDMADPNWRNRTLFHGDNLAFLRAMNSESVDLIVTDPPFNKSRDFHAMPDSLAAGAKVPGSVVVGTRRSPRVDGPDHRRSSSAHGSHRVGALCPQ